MKVALLGGGGFRTPLTFLALQRVAAALSIDELVLQDLDAARLARMTAVLDGLQTEAAGPPLHLSATTDLRQAVHGARFVLCAVRVGGLEARAIDERVPLAEGVVGQETVGPGGLSLILRSVPILTEIGRVIARDAPDAWVINFSNPVGAMTSVLRESVGDRVLGVCDTPTGLCRGVATALDKDPSRLHFDYFGLNHLGWLRAVRDGDGRDWLPALLRDDVALSRLDEGRLFGATCLRTLNMVPSEYLLYYYFPERHLEAVAAAGYSRAEYLLTQQHGFYASPAGADAARDWRSVRAERDRSYLSDTHSEAPTAADRADEAAGDGYASVAVAIIYALASNTSTTAIVNQVNGSCLPFLSPDAIVELPGVINATGVSARGVADVAEHSRILMQRVHSAERHAVQASRGGSRALAIEALAMHPLIDSPERASRVFAGYERQHAWLRERFA